MTIQEPPEHVTEDAGLDGLDAEYNKREGRPNGETKPLPVFETGESFVAAWRPRRSLIPEWDLKRGWLYSLTAPTGYAKTAIALAESLELARQGLRVVYFAGENPDDVRQRLILMKFKLGLERLPETVRFVATSFNLVENIDHIQREVDALGGADAAFIDTSPVYQIASGGLEENSNPEAIRWAQHLRQLTRLKGEPAILSLCHPIKRPQSVEDCLPRGGGGFIAEVDGNFTLWPAGESDNERFFEFGWTGKFRGYFTPLQYRLENATCPVLADPDGKPIYSVWAQRCDAQRTERAASRQRDDEDALIITMHNDPDHSMSAWAEALGWRSTTGEPLKSRVHRTLERLKAERLVTQKRGNWTLTATGKTEAKRLEDQAQ